MNFELALWRIEKADTTFEEGEISFENHFYEGAVNRFYYASFHAARSLLATKGLDAPKHKGIISLFNREFVKTGLMSIQSSKTIKKLFDMRTVADYRDFATFTEEQVREARDDVRALIDEAISFLQREMQKGKTEGNE